MSRDSWNVKNTIEVPKLTVKLLSNGADYDSGLNIKLLIHNGMFNGANWQLDRAYMTTPPTAGVPWSTVALGTVTLFKGVTGAIKLSARGADITVNGRNVKMQGYLPRNIYTLGCIHALYDAGCTLNAADFTITQTVGSGSAPNFITWGETAPTTPGLYSLGTIAMTSGAADGQTRTILTSSSEGLLLSYPLFEAPSVGDTLDVIRGCAHTRTACKSFGASPGNIANYRGFPFIPPAFTTL